jgi:hypothetical protein
MRGGAASLAGQAGFRRKRDSSTAWADIIGGW